MLNTFVQILVYLYVFICLMQSSVAFVSIRLRFELGHSEFSAVPQTCRNGKITPATDVASSNE